MKENIDQNIPQQKNLISKKNKTLIQNLKNKEFFNKSIFTPSELLLKKQNNHVALTKRKEPKIIEFLNTKDFSCQVDSNLPINTPLFEAIPPVIMFSDYEALNVKTAILKLRNRDQVARRVKIIQPETNLFRINPLYQNDNIQGNKIAPGLDLYFEIKFSPERKTDYKYDLIIVTEREKFIVPVIAIGKKPLIVFPDEINFGLSCPVKYYTEKPIIIHNQGEKTAKWEIKLPPNFEANKQEGILSEKCSDQIVMKFYPTERKHYQAYGQLMYDDDIAQFSLLGNAINGEVYLSKNYIQQEETYISLESRDTFKIVNKSNVKIDFEWRSFSSEKEENEKKNILLEQIKTEEDEKRQLIYETLELEDNINNYSQDSDVEDVNLDEINEKEQILKKRKKAEMLLDRKYKAIRKAIEEDTLVFEDDIFDIQPVKGSIWPNSEMTITVIFKPKASLKYLQQAYCNISCSDQRLPLYMEGEGLGPKAFLSTNSLSISDIFVNDKQMFNIYIENKGEIPANFSLIKNNSTFSKMITFDIEEAQLAVGQRMNIIMTFQSSKVGEFQELFKWKLEGSSEVLSLLVRGHVQAPKFEFSRKSIDFQKVSYQFEKSEEIELSNTSTVPFSFELRIPHDGKGTFKEFEIVPNRDEIQPNETKKIMIKFIPHFRKLYKCVMVLDILGIGKDMKSIPIFAESEIPQVKISPDVLDFGKIFLRYKQTKEIELINESNLYARFVVHRLNPKYEALGTISSDLDKGQIAPKSSIKINIHLTTTCIKTFEMDFVIEIVSDKNIQHMIKVKANSTGPDVELSRKEIDFGEIEVLKNYVQKVTLTNKSVIKADFFAFTKNKNSIFKPLQKRYILKPEESFDVEIVCYADDQQKFQDTLYFVIKEGVDKEVQLKAKAVGSTIFCKDISQISFGTLYTHKNYLQEVFLENKGRRVQNLRWQRKIEKGEENQDQNIYSIFPETVSLPPKTGLMFQFKAFSTIAGEQQENFILTSAIGTERKQNTLFVSQLQGNFFKPSLQFSEKKLEFKYIWNKNEEPSIITQNLLITSKGPLPTSFSLHIEPPFEVLPKTFALHPGKQGIVKIDFNPRLNQNKFSNKISEKLFIKHNKHPKKESFDIIAEFCYPNLQLNETKVDFGAVMNDTSKKKYILMENTGIIDVEYEWFFIDDGSNHDIPINEVFDILPLRGKIEPGVTEKVEFYYYAVPKHSFSITAVCKTIGGPQYSVEIGAEASDVDYEVVLQGNKDKKLIDLGEVYLNQKIQKYFEIENKSKVIFEYTVRLDTSGPRSQFMKKFLNIQPNKGVIKGTEKQRIKINMIPAFPQEICEYLVLQVAHFEPQKICIKGNGIFPSLRINQPMQIDEKMDSFMERKYRQMTMEDDEGKYQLIQQMSDVQVIQMETFIIKSFIKENFEKLINETTFNFAKSTSKKISSKNSLINVSTKQISSNQMLSKLKNNLHFMEDILLGTYQVNLGTIIAGQKAIKTIELKNIGKQFLSLDIDLANSKIPGLHLSFQKVHKLSPNGNTELVLTLKTKKNIKEAIIKSSLPIKVLNGGKYIIELEYFITYPDLTLSQEIVDFQNVLVGTSKTITIRLQNNKIIPCSWQVQNQVKNIPTKKKNQIRFFLNQNNGHLDENSQSNFEVRFEPKGPGNHEEIYEFTFKDSTSKIKLVCKGTGIIPAIEFEHDSIKFPPSLPNTTSFKPFSILNNSEFDLNLILGSMNESILKKIQQLQFSSQSQYLKPLLSQNQEFWTDIQEECQINMNNKRIQEEIKILQEGEQEGKMEQINELKSQIQDYNPIKSKFSPVKFENQVNLLLLSDFVEIPKKVSQFLQIEFKKQPVDLSELLQWNLNEQTAIGLEVQKILDDKQQEYAQLMNPKNKRKNQPEMTETEFMYLDENKFKELLNGRLKASECRAGCILFNFTNKLISVQKQLNILQEYFRKSNLVVIDIRKQIEPLSFPKKSENEKETKLEGNKEETEKGGVQQSQIEEIHEQTIQEEPPTQLQFRKIDLNSINDSEMENIISKFYANKKQLARHSLVIGNLKRIDEFSTNSENESLNEIVRQHFNSQIIPTNEGELQNELAPEKLPFQLVDIIFSNNLLKLNYKLMDLIPKPVFQKSGELPLPESILEQVIKKPATLRQFKFISNVEILTYKNQVSNLDRIIRDHDPEDGQVDAQAIDHEQKEIDENNFSKYLEQGLTSWHVPAKGKLYLCLKFYSQDIIKIQDEITFEYSNAIWNEYHKGWTMGVEAQTLYPEFSKNIINIFSNRRKKAFNKKHLPNHKYYDTASKKFYFGPILVRNDGDDNKLQAEQLESYLATMRITNISPFPINISFQLKPLVVQEEPKKVQNNQKKPVILEERFIVKEKNKEILPQETYNFQIEANPRKQENFEQNLAITVANNPEEFIVPISYQSLYPSIELNHSFMSFDKLVLQKSSQKSFEIKNTSLCEINWSILNFEQLKASNFEISPTEGSLKIGQHITVDVTFFSKEEKKYDEKIIFDISSSENINIKSQNKYQIDLTAEGFKILVDFMGFADPSKMILNFGETQVQKSVKKSFQMVNNGQYPIDLEMFFFKKNVERYFEYEKNKIKLLPKGQKEVSILFLALDEIKIDHHQKVFLTIRILEQESQDVFKEVKIEIKAMSQYSRFLINPQKQLNFGPVVFSEVRKRTFEIINNGIFDFEFDLYDFSQKQVQEEIIKKYEALLISDENDKKKQSAKPPNKQKNQDLLQIEAYSITPCNGKISPGKSAEISVTFEGKENKWYEVKLGVEIFNRNRKESPEFHFMLIGDSCIPSIENKKLRNIFEEQLVTQSLNSTGVNIQNIVHGNVFAQEENTFFFRNLIPSQYPDGISEKFKLINNGKVNVDLQIELQKKGKSLFGFSVEPQKISIAPHEFVYVKINFKPEIMAVYEGIFIAKVLHLAAKEKDNFVFNLKGEGILPTLQIYNEEIVNDQLDFGKVRSDRFKIQQVVVQNRGQIPATALMRLLNSKQFRLISLPEKTIQPKEFYSFEIEFSSTKPGVFETQLELDTNLNPFEKNMLTLKGESFFEQICFEGIQNDILKFTDILMKPEVNKLGKQYFEMKNYSNQTIRYEWQDLPDHLKWIKIEPKTGHIAPNMFKRIKVTLYRPEIEKQYQINQVAVVKFQPIHIAVNQQILKQRQWDSLKRQKKMVTRTEKDWLEKCSEIEKNFQIELKKNKKAKKPQLPPFPEIPENEEAVHQVLNFIPEPVFSFEDETPKTLNLQIYLKLDVPKIECSVNQIFFKPTKMFSNRIFSFQVKNSSCVKINYEIEFFDKFTGTTEPGYYTVQPSGGYIDQLSSKDFIVKFSPLECEHTSLNRTLIFKIIGTSITHQIEISGVSERPICHFELPNLNSDNQEKIVEIQSIGYSNTNLKKFYILNPTSLGYDFNWTFDHSMNSYIKCLTPKGTIFPGKKFELIFEFNPTKNCPDKVEKIFSFNIPKHNITHQFLFQGILLQPKIFFSKAKIDFGALLLSGKGKETIIIKNLDDVSYHFNFSRQSIKGQVQSHYNSLQVSPLSGQLGPFQEIPINLIFLPKHETEFNYNLLCNIRNKKDPLTLNVKGIGYKLHNQLFLKKQLIRPNFLHEIDFKEIFVNETKQQILTLENRGEFNFDFIIYQKVNSSIKISPENGTVRQNESLQIAIIFEPKQEIKLNTKIKLSIISGPDYKFEIKGNAIYPDILFKPQVIDFGSVLVTNNPIVVEKTIKIINNDQKALILDSNFVKNDHLDLKLAPSQSILPYNNNKLNILRIPVFLNLRKLGKIKEEIEFLIQNNYKVKVMIKGEGVPLQVELENPENINVNMGELKVNERNIKNINIINNSKVPVTLDFDVFDQIQKLMKQNIHFNSSQLQISSKSMSSLDIVFSPKQRIRNFSIPIQYKIKESSEHFELLCLKGACYGIDLKIIEENVDFREVVINSELSQKFHVVNLGDINTEYKWDLGFLNNYFKILPLEGVIQSNQRIQFEAIFAPNSLNKYKATAKLIVGNMESTLRLEMTGVGIDTPPEAIQTVEFECPVRQSIVKKTIVKNDSDQDWHIMPTINFDNHSNGYFNIDGQIDITARQSKEIEISYKPLTLKPSIQSATLFLPLKNGKAILIKLIGKPLAPQIQQVFNVQIEAKQLSYHTISIPNWLPFTQRLKAKFVLENDQDPITKGIKINSAEMIDIQQGQHQNYKICLYALKAGQEKLKVMFTNVENQEYILYQIDLVIKESQMLKEIDFESNIREITKKVILLENSLPKDVVLEEKDVQLNSNNIFITSKFPLILPANKDFGLEIGFRPLIILENQEVWLQINSIDLGTFKYKFVLNSRKNNNIQNLNFKAKIGDSSPNNFSFINYLNKPAVYQITIKGITDQGSQSKEMDFYTSQTQIQVPASSERSNNEIEIRFEPSFLGTSKNLMTVSNPEGGSYDVYLIGTSQLPLPKGPFKISQKGFPIEFKNPFFTAKEFQIKLENQSFTCNQKKMMKLEGKKTVSINIQYKPSDNPNGRLIVSLNEIQWVFYLQGVVEKK